MDINQLPTQQRILFEMYNAIAIEDIDLEKLDECDEITYSEYFQEHMTNPMNYIIDSPLSERIIPIYKSLSEKDKRELLKIVATQENFRDDYFYEADWVDLSEDEKDELSYDEVTDYLVNYILSSCKEDCLSEDENRLISLIESQFAMMISLVDPGSLTICKYEYEESVLGDLEVFTGM